MSDITTSGGGRRVDRVDAWTRATAGDVAMIRPHEWVPAREVGLNRDWTVCRNCGFILRGDRENEAAACKGRVRVELRESPDTQPVVDLTPRCCP